ncbi:MAG: hypothetical protein OEY70_16125, partial [Acidimicrobiia bacterium]|nr:hypothetical protein [Acidimicrobiia bacterium]
GVGGPAGGRTVAAGRGVAGVVAERAVAGSAVAGSDGVPDGRFAGSVGGGRRTTASLLVGPAGGGDGVEPVTRAGAGLAAVVVVRPGRGWGRGGR